MRVGPGKLVVYMETEEIAKFTVYDPARCSVCILTFYPENGFANMQWIQAVTNAYA